MNSTAQFFNRAIARSSVTVLDLSKASGIPAPDLYQALEGTAKPHILFHNTIVRELGLTSKDLKRLLDISF